MTLGSIPWNQIVGGFGMFLFGIKFMGDGLKSVAGDKLRDYIDKYTTKPFMAILIGAFVTILIQSSSATTAITIGLVRAGLMKLEQAAGIVMGANIGTTVTAFLISMNIDQFALYFVFVGALIISFGKRKKIRYIGDIIFGFGLLFFGLSIMGDSLKMLKDLPAFASFAETMSTQPLLALLAGTLMTALIQGSAATIGVVQKIYEAGGMTFMAVLPFVFGSNIGTTITGILAAMGGSLAAKRTAGLHTLFNVVGTVIGMVLLVPYSSFILSLANHFNISPMMQIAVAHIIFNVATTLIFFPFLKQMCMVIRKVIPGDEPEKIEINIDELDAAATGELPSTALSIAQKAIMKMSTVVDRTTLETKQFFLKRGSSEDVDVLKQNESLINGLDDKITAYLMKIAKADLTESDINEMNLHLDVVKNLERIGDLSMNLTEFYDMVYDDKGSFSKDAIEDMSEMFDLTSHMLNRAMQIYEKRDYALYTSLMEDENYMDKLEYTSRQKHFERMSKNECTDAVAGSVYCDIIGTMERMADHACNIARNAVDTNPKDPTAVAPRH